MSSIGFPCFTTGESLRVAISLNDGHDGLYLKNTMNIDLLGQMCKTVFVFHLCSHTCIEHHSHKTSFEANCVICKVLFFQKHFIFIHEIFQIKQKKSLYVFITSTYFNNFPFTSPLTSPILLSLLLLILRQIQDSI